MKNTERMKKIVLAARDEYLRRERIKFIRLLSIAATAIGVLALIIIISVYRNHTSVDSGDVTQMAQIKPYRVIEAHREEDGIIVVVSDEEINDEGREWGLQKDSGETVPIVEVQKIEEDTRNMYYIRTGEKLDSINYMLSNGIGGNVLNYEIPAEKDNTSETESQ